MKTSAICIVALLAALVGFSGPAMAQSAQALPIPETTAATSIPGAHELPDPSLTYKVAFTVKKAAPKVDEVNPRLIAIARYDNTLAANGVSPEHRKIVVVFNGDTIFLNNAAFKASHDGHDNPNIALIQSMSKAGIEFHVCGQELLGRKISKDELLPEVQVDLWAMTSVINLQTRGYVFIGD